MKDPGWKALKGAVQQRLGIRLPPSLESRLEDRAHRLIEAGHARSFSQLSAVVLEVERDHPVLDELREATSIVETYFCRGQRQLERLSELLEGMTEKPAALRVLSAGCATGEEAYTLSSLASEALPGTRIEVVGVDMNRRALELARRAEYGPRSVRNEAARTLPIEQVGGRWRVTPAARRGVSFVEGNLVTDDLAALLPGSFDVIALRNVLLYSAPRDAERVVTRLLALASPRAWFVAGAMEETLVQALLPGFTSRGSGVWARGDAPQRTAEVVREAPRRLPLSIPVASPRKFEPLRSNPHSDAVLKVREVRPSPLPLSPLAQGEGEKPAVVVSLSSLAQAHRAADRGDWDAATRAVRAAMHADPDAPTPRWLAGVVELGRGDAAAAQRHFEAALFLQRDFIPAMLGLAQALERAGRDQPARARYQQVLEAARALPPGAQVAALDLSAAALARVAQSALEGNMSHG